MPRMRSGSPSPINSTIGWVERGPRFERRGEALVVLIVQRSRSSPRASAGCGCPSRRGQCSGSGYGSGFRMMPRTTVKRRWRRCRGQADEDGGESGVQPQLAESVAEIGSALAIEAAMFTSTIAMSGEAKSFVDKHNCRMPGHQCYHCKQWVEEGEAHDCWTTIAALTRTQRGPAGRIRAAARDGGRNRRRAAESTRRTTRWIMFSRKTCYFFVRPKRKYLEVVVFLWARRCVRLR